MKNKKIEFGEKAASISTGLSGGLSFLGGWQVCHNLCLGLIALLSLIGITVVGMPLLFLTKVAVPFWIIAVGLFIITLMFYFKMKCISKNLIIFNSGIIIASVPFSQVQNYSLIFWIIGGSLVLISIVFYIKNKIKKSN